MIKDIVEKVVGDDSLIRDFAAICDTGGRFAGSCSEQAAREYLSDRLEAATGAVPMHAPVDYLGWSRGDAVLERLDGTGRSRQAGHPMERTTVGHLGKHGISSHRFASSRDHP